MEWLADRSYLSQLGLDPTPPLNFRNASAQRPYNEELDFAYAVPEEFAAQHVENWMDNASTASDRLAVRSEDQEEQDNRRPYRRLFERAKASVANLLTRKDSNVMPGIASHPASQCHRAEHHAEQGIIVRRTKGEGGISQDSSEALSGSEEVVASDDTSSIKSSLIAQLTADFLDNDSGWGSELLDQPTSYGNAMVAAVEAALSRGSFDDHVRQARFDASFHASTTEEAQNEAAVLLRNQQ